MADNFEPYTVQPVAELLAAITAVCGLPPSSVRSDLLASMSKMLNAICNPTLAVMATLRNKEDDR